MIEDIYDPLTEYTDKYKERFRVVAETTFEELAEEANVDVEANRKICQNIYDSEKTLANIKSDITWWTILCVVLWIIVVAGVIYVFVSFEDMETELFLVIGIAATAAIVFLIKKVHPNLKELKALRDNMTLDIEKLKTEAWAQMEPLNSLYDWDVLARMMTKTVPRLEFDPYFTSQRLADLQKTYGWDGSFNNGRSVIYSHSGLINGNPFVLCRTRKMEMGVKTYEGTKTIRWTTTERTSDGKYRTVEHTQTLTAYYTAPYPEYYENTRLIYANTAAPDLTFYRKKSNLASKEKSLSFKWKEYKLRKKARNLKDNDYAMMTNEVFEVAFDTSNRNNNHQFSLLFTPLAQESMLSLLKDEEVGFGDDFDFGKNKMINTIVPDHLQNLDLDMNPRQYMDFDYDKARLKFYTINAQYFHAIYFSFAPLLCVPLYQQIRPLHDIYGHSMKLASTFWEHEALANFWGQDYFMHSSCVTDCILKTEQNMAKGDDSTITVYAHGYRMENRVTDISVYGGDGRWHNVPVYWNEYFPVVGQGTILMKEDNNFDDSSVTHRERVNHINNLLGSSNLSVYRRHIASKMC